MITLEINDRVAILTLNRASRRNALCSAMIVELGEIVHGLDDNADVGAVVLTGAAPSFCAGSDLKELGGMNVPQMVAHEAATAALARQLGLIGVPVIAAVEGHALGGGFILAASCDLVVSAEDAKWSLPEVPNGWIPPWGLKALAVRVGPVAARRLTWGFEVLDGPKAVSLGVADFSVAPGEALAHARELASQVAALPAPAVRSTKHFFQTSIIGDAEIWDAAAGRAFAADCEHEAARATLARFAAKA